MDMRTAKRIASPDVKGRVLEVSAKHFQDLWDQYGSVDRFSNPVIDVDSLWCWEAGVWLIPTLRTEVPLCPSPRRIDPMKVVETV